MTSESQFQQQLLDLAALYGWRLSYHTYDSRRSNAGWPDLVLAGHGRVLFIELKSSKGKPSAAQIEWLTALSDAGCEAALWRPSDLAFAATVLGPRQVRLGTVQRVH